MVRAGASMSTGGSQRRYNKTIDICIINYMPISVGLPSLPVPATMGYIWLQYDPGGCIVVIGIFIHLNVLLLSSCCPTNFPNNEVISPSACARLTPPLVVGSRRCRTHPGTPHPRHLAGAHFLARPTRFTSAGVGCFTPASALPFFGFFSSYCSAVFCLLSLLYPSIVSFSPLLKWFVSGL